MAFDSCSICPIGRRLSDNDAAWTCRTIFHCVNLLAGNDVEFGAQCVGILTPNIEGCIFSDMKNEGYEGLIRVIEGEFLQYHTIRRYRICPAITGNIDRWLHNHRNLSITHGCLISAVSMDEKVISYWNIYLVILIGVGYHCGLSVIYQGLN